MSLDKSMVLKISNLSRISIPDEELPKVLKELSSIVDWMQQLDEVDTSKVEPMTGGTDIKMNWRNDEVSDGGYSEKVLANAPKVKDGFFEVPKVVE